MKKNKQDYSFYINILFIILIAIASFFVYTKLGKKDAVSLVKEIQVKDNTIPIQEPLQQKNSESKKNIPDFKNYKYKYIYTIDIQGFVKHLDFSVLLPVDEKEKQYISDMNISIKPSKIYNDGINTIAEYSFDNLNTQKINIIIEGNAKVRTYNIKTAKEINKKLTNEKDINKYLQSENLIESNDSMIKNTAKKITGTTREEIVQNIYEYIQKNISYKIINYNAGAKQALIQKYGKCSEYAAAMVALCRAKNIPARIVIGNIAREQIPQHNWVEVWYDDYGWVTYDPTVQATVLNIYKNGKLERQEKKYDTSNDKMKYIISGKNKFNLSNMRYSVSETKNGKAHLTEQIQIKKID